MCIFFSLRRPRPATLFPYTTLFRSRAKAARLPAPRRRRSSAPGRRRGPRARSRTAPVSRASARTEEHTSELQSQSNLVCRLLLVKKNNIDKLDDALDDVLMPWHLGT